MADIRFSVNVRRPICHHQDYVTGGRLTGGGVADERLWASDGTEAGTDGVHAWQFAESCVATGDRIHGMWHSKKIMRSTFFILINSYFLFEN